MFYIGVNMAKKEKANGMAILNEQINKKEFSRVYLLGGTEPYLIYQYRDKLIAAMINPNDTMNFILPIRRRRNSTLPFQIHRNSKCLLH